LENLHVDVCSLTVFITQMNRLQKLTSLRLCATHCVEPSPLTLPALPLPNLNYLEIGDIEKVDVTGLSALKGFSFSPFPTTREVEEFIQIQGIEQINSQLSFLHLAWFNPKDMKRISKLRNLSKLELYFPEWTADQQRRKIKILENIKDLTLRGPTTFWAESHPLRNKNESKETTFEN
jgi:hypothetical protein